MTVIHSSTARATRSGLAALLLCFGCTADETDPVLAPPPVTGAQVEPGPSRGELKLVDALDLLFVIDNSGSMASEQVRLASELDRFVRILTLGDRQPEAPGEPDRSNKARYFNPVKDLHLAVISTNVGGLDDPFGASPATQSCRGLGDGGRFQSDLTVARDGIRAQSQFEFEGFPVNEVVFPPDPSCDLPLGPPYLQFAVRTSSNAEEIANRFRCMTRLGVRGCAFEQPFEAMRRALAAPGTTTQDASLREVHQYNAGFLRENAILAVVHISDEDDCSITERGKLLFDTTPNSEAEQLYGRKINLRCGLHGDSPGLLWSVDSYAEHLRALKPGHPERVLFAGIVGIPNGLSAELTFDGLLARPDMSFREEGDSGLPVPSCVREDPTRPERSDKAHPPRRFVQLAKQLGSSATLHSICADDYGPALASVVDRVAPMMAP